MRPFVAIAGLLLVTSAAGAAGCDASRRRERGAAAAVPAPASESGRYVAPLFDPARAPDLLDAPDRDRWQQPARVVRALRLRPGDAVADIGAGSGYLLPHLSAAVGPAGRVYAQEIQDAFLPALRRHARALPNVRVVLGTADDPRLPAGGVDCFVLLTVYHEVQRPVAFLRTLHRHARPGARLAVIDFDDGRRGSPPAPVAHWVREHDVLAEARRAGWDLQERHEFLSSQFFLVFRRRPAAPRSPEATP